MQYLEVKRFLFDNVLLWPQFFALTETKENYCRIKTSLIFGGEYADPHEFPWIVKLNMDNCKHKFCGGSIISENIILTAAHCVVRGLLDSDIPVL